MVKVRKDTAGYEELMRSLRRQLHMQPELSDCEYDTQAFIVRFLEGLRLDKVQCLADTGVKGVILAPGAYETIGFRADMDALLITEQNDIPFASRREGNYACLRP